MVPIRLKRKGVFPFLKLPRELRDEIYCHVLGIQAGVSKVIYDSVKSQVRQHTRHNATPHDSGLNTSLLLTNHVIHQEYIEALHRNSRFFVIMDARSCILRNKIQMLEDPKYRSKLSICFDAGSRPPGESSIHKNEMDVKATVSHGWNLSKIEDLCLRINLGKPGDRKVTLDSFQFSALADMTSLTHLIIVVTVWEQYQETNPSLDYWGLGTVEAKGSEDLRAMLRRLRAVVPSSVCTLDFGLVGGQRPEGWSTLKDACCVAGRMLEALYHEC